MLIRCVPPIHPSTIDKWYCIALDATEHAGADVTSATWSAEIGASVSIGTSSSYSNPGDGDHPSGYTGPVCCVQLSAAGGATEGDIAEITLEYETDRTEGPLHVTFQVRVSKDGR